MLQQIHDLSLLFLICIVAISATFPFSETTPLNSYPNATSPNKPIICTSASTCSECAELSNEGNDCVWCYSTSQCIPDPQIYSNDDPAAPPACPQIFTMRERYWSWLWINEDLKADAAEGGSGLHLDSICNTNWKTHCPSPDADLQYHVSARLLSQSIINKDNNNNNRPVSITYGGTLGISVHVYLLQGQQPQQSSNYTTLPALGYSFLSYPADASEVLYSPSPSFIVSNTTYRLSSRSSSRSRSSNDTNAIFNVTEIRLRPASDQFYGPPGNYEMQLLVAIQDHSNNGTTICFATNTTVVAFNVGHSTLYLIASAVPYLLLVSGGFIGMLITTFVFFRNKPKRKLRRSLKEEQHAGDGSATEEEEEDDEDDLTVYTDNPTTVATTTTTTGGFSSDEEEEEEEEEWNEDDQKEGEGLIHDESATGGESDFRPTSKTEAELELYFAATACTGAASAVPAAASPGYTPHQKRRRRGRGGGGLLRHIMFSAVKFCSKVRSRSSLFRVAKAKGLDAYFLLSYEWYIFLFTAVFALIFGVPLIFADYLTSGRRCGFLCNASFINLIPNLQFNPPTEDSSHNNAATIIYWVHNAAAAFVVLGVLTLGHVLRSVVRHLPFSNNKKRRSYMFSDPTGEMLGFGSEHTAMIRNLPTGLVDPRPIRIYLEQKYGVGSVLRVQIAYSNPRLVETSTALSEARRKLRKLLRTKSKKQKQKQKQKQKSSPKTTAKAEAAVNKLKAQITEYEEKLKELRSATRGTGTAFAVFRTREIAQRFLKEESRQTQVRFANVEDSYAFNQLSELVLRANKWRRQQAPPGSDINWDNLRYSRLNRALRSLVYNIVFALSLFLLLAVLNAAQYLVFDAEVVLPLPDSIGLRLLMTFLYSIGDDLPQVLISLAITAIIRVTSKFEIHLTKSGESNSILLKTAFYQFFAIIVLSTSFGAALTSSLYKIPYQDNYSKLVNYTEAINVFYLSFLVSSPCIKKFIDLLIIIVLNLKARLVDKQTVRPQHTFDPLYEYSLTFTMFLIVINFGSHNPLIYVVASASFALNYILSKFMITFVYARSTDSNGRALDSIDLCMSLFLIYCTSYFNWIHVAFTKSFAGAAKSAFNFFIFFAVLEALVVGVALPLKYLAVVPASNWLIRKWRSVSARRSSTVASLRVHLLDSEIDFAPTMATGVAVDTNDIFGTKDDSKTNNDGNKRLSTSLIHDNRILQAVVNEYRQPHFADHFN